MSPAARVLAILLLGALPWLGYLGAKLLNPVATITQEQLQRSNERYYNEGCLAMFKVVEAASGGFFEEPDDIRKWCNIMSKITILPAEECNK